MISFTISLNGPDNIGKTTQLALLPDHFTISKVGGLHENDERIRQLQLQGCFRDWWWNSSSDDFVCTIFRALARRYWNSTATNSGSEIDLVIFDRGVTMFEAVAVAMTSIKRSDDNLDAARQVVDEILQKNGLVMPRENFAILLRHIADDLRAGVKLTLSREEDPHDERYAHYQYLLQTELLNQEARGAYQHVIQVSQTDSYDKLQDTLRKVLFEKTRNPLFQPMLHPIQAVYGFSGLSESGKSTLAEAFCDALEPHRGFRAKIVYFNNIASQRLGRSIYTLPDQEQALHLLHELENFARTHYWLRVVTIESLHRAGVTRLLKSWLGDKLRVIYIDVDDSRRLSRSLVTLDELQKNDKLKRERGVEKIAAEADFVLDNNSTFVDSFESLMNFAESKEIMDKEG